LTLVIKLFSSRQWKTVFDLCTPLAYEGTHYKYRWYRYDYSNFSGKNWED